MFNKKITKKRLQQHKTVKIDGMKFVIKKINPLLDFPADRMPQIFTSFVSKRKVNPEQQLNEHSLRRSQEDVKLTIAAALIEPKLGDEITVEDIMTDATLTLKLYTEILVHSMNMFKGWKGLFFSAKIRRSLYSGYQENIEKLPTK